MSCSLLCAYRAYHDAGRPDHVDEGLEKPGSRGSDYLSKCGTRREHIFARPMEKLGGEFRKQALDSGVTVIEIDRKPLEAALTGLYTKVLTDSHSRDLIESIQKDQ